MSRTVRKRGAMRKAIRAPFHEAKKYTRKYTSKNMHKHKSWVWCNFEVWGRAGFAWQKASIATYHDPSIWHPFNNEYSELCMVLWGSFWHGLCSVRRRWGIAHLRPAIWIDYKRVHHQNTRPGGADVVNHPCMIYQKVWAVRIVLRSHHRAMPRSWPRGVGEEQRISWHLCVWSHRAVRSSNTNRVLGRGVVVCAVEQVVIQAYLLDPWSFN